MLYISNDPNIIELNATIKKELIELKSLVHGGSNPTQIMSVQGMLTEEFLKQRKQIALN